MKSITLGISLLLATTATFNAKGTSLHLHHATLPTPHGQDMPMKGKMQKSRRMPGSMSMPMSMPMMDMKKMMADMAADKAKLSALVARMDAAPGADKVQAVSDVVDEMVRQQSKMQKMCMMMMDGMSKMGKMANKPMPMKPMPMKPMHKMN